MFTPVQLSVIPAQCRETFLAYVGKGMRPSKAAGKCGITLTQEQIMLLSADVNSVRFAVTETDIADIYSNTQYGQSCMTRCPEGVGYFYSRIGAQLAYNDGARCVVNPVARFFGRIYGEKSSDLYYSLLALGYRESEAPLAGLSGNFQTRHVTNEPAEDWVIPGIEGVPAEDIMYLKGYVQAKWLEQDGKIYVFHSYFSGGNIFLPAKRVVRKGTRVVMKVPRIYLDGGHNVVRQGNKVIIAGNGEPGYVDFEHLPRIMPQFQRHRAIERKTIADVADEYESRLRGWRY